MIKSNSILIMIKSNSILRKRINLLPRFVPQNRKEVPTKKWKSPRDPQGEVGSGISAITLLVLVKHNQLYLFPVLSFLFQVRSYISNSYCISLRMFTC